MGINSPHPKSVVFFHNGTASVCDQYGQNCQWTFICLPKPHRSSRLLAAFSRPRITKPARYHNPVLRMVAFLCAYALTC